MTGPTEPTGATGPAGRVNVDLPALLAHVGVVFALGYLDHWTVLTTGYEDCNIDLTTSRTRVVVKVFAADRAPDIAVRTVSLITAAQAAGVRHPRFYRDHQGCLVHVYHGHRIVVMDHVPGRTVYTLDRALSPVELAAVVEQTALIHTLDVTVGFVCDPWGINNLPPLAAHLRPVLDAEQTRLVGAALDANAGIERAALPIALIHADLTQGNVIVGADATVTVLDFAVANWLPRVQELAVIAANLTHGVPEPLPARTETIAEIYSATAPIPLTVVERRALRAYSHAATAMELLGALREWHHGNRGPETDFLIDLGLTGLRDYRALS